MIRSNKIPWSIRNVFKAVVRLKIRCIDQEQMKWNSRQWIGSSSNNMLGCRYIYLGLFDNEVEAARFLSLDSPHWCTIKKLFLFSPSTEVPTRISSLCFSSSLSCPGKIRAYDKAAIKCNGREAVTNFEPSTYDMELLSEVAAEGNSIIRNLIFLIFSCLLSLIMQNSALGI